MLVGSMCLFGAGETTRPSLIAIEVNIVNVILAWLFSGVDMTYGAHTFKNPGWFHLHVIGIALGTAVGYLWGAVRTIMVLRKGVKDLRLEVQDWKPEQSMVWRITRIGIPNFLEGLSMWGVNLFVLAFIGMIGKTESVDGGLQGAHIIAVQ
jgi:Na+-driven multidrug efflux pump